MRKKVVLICEDCLGRNYHTTKNRYSETRLEIKKFCPTCKNYTLHKESR